MNSLNTAELIQGSEAWVSARLGKVTASRIADVMAKTKTGWSASRANYAAQLVAERLTGEAGETFTNAAMKWGTETEPYARAAYEFMTDEKVTLVGFIQHPKIAMSGASPDGLIGDDGLLEIKAPNTSTHIETLLGSGTDRKYLLQMQWQMAVTGRSWCDFVSFDPRLPEAMRLSITRHNRDAVLIAELEREVAAFLAEVAETISRLRARYGANENAIAAA